MQALGPARRSPCSGSRGLDHTCRVQGRATWRTMDKLAPYEHYLAHSVVDRFEHALLVQGVVDGTLPGWLAVDSREEPRALLASIPGAHYLLGDPGNLAWNAAVSDMVVGEILPRGKQAGWAVLNLHYAPDVWEDLLDSIFAEAVVVKNHQRFFRFRQRRVDWRVCLPARFSLRQLDAELFGQHLGPNLERIRESLEEDYGSLVRFLEYGFGFCLLDGDEIASWCTTDCISGQRCELGVYTDRRYRRRGLATAVVAATVDHCLANDLPEIGWHCWSQNLASAAVARRVGFEEVGQHRAVHVWMNPVDGHLVNGNLALLRGAYREAAEHYERAFNIRKLQGDDPKTSLLDWKDGEHVYRYHAACAWALTGDSVVSWRHLELALEAGTFRLAGY